MHSSRLVKSPLIVIYTVIIPPWSLTPIFFEENPIEIEDLSCLISRWKNKWTSIQCIKKKKAIFKTLILIEYL